MKSLDQVDVSGKKVLIRVDFNVPMDDQGNITDDTRIRAHLPSINFVTERGGKAILASHLGRPKGVAKPELSLAPIAVRLSELLGAPVALSRGLRRHSTRFGQVGPGRLRSGGHMAPGGPPTA